MKHRSDSGYIAYIRISDARKQGQGASLDAQRSLITSFADRENLRIVRWVEERESASSTGRTQFQQVLRLLRRHDAQGLIFHKVDRSSRNIEDWKELRVLGELGFDIYFAAEGVNLRNVEDVLVADIFAAIASHYTRNLRQEVLKGMRGRLRQGIYPFQAPIGYVDQGAGKPKSPDPVLAPLIAEAFELYDSGRHGLVGLREEMHRRGLRNHSGTRVSVNGMNRILRNPFYMGQIKIRRWRETFPGAHDAIVTPEVFERVQARLDGRTNGRSQKHVFLFRRMLKCATCGLSLIGETSKGISYYRCHTRSCPTNSIRESAIESHLTRRLADLRWTSRDYRRLRDGALSRARRSRDRRRAAQRSSQLLLDRNEGKLSRLVDAHLDGRISEALFKLKQEELGRERIALEQRARGAAIDHPSDDVSTFLELVQSAWILYNSAPLRSKRMVVDSYTSNWVVSAKTPLFSWRIPFAQRQELAICAEGTPHRDEPRTSDQVLEEIVNMLVGLPADSLYPKLVRWYEAEGKLVLQSRENSTADS